MIVKCVKSENSQANDAFHILETACTVCAQIDWIGFWIEFYTTPSTQLLAHKAQCIGRIANRCMPLYAFAYASSPETDDDNTRFLATQYAQTFNGPNSLYFFFSCSPMFEGHAITKSSDRTVRKRHAIEKCVAKYHQNWRCMIINKCLRLGIFKHKQLIKFKWILQCVPIHKWGSIVCSLLDGDVETKILWVYQSKQYLYLNGRWNTDENCTHNCMNVILCVVKGIHSKPVVYTYITTGASPNAQKSLLYRTDMHANMEYRHVKWNLIFDNWIERAKEKIWV